MQVISWETIRRSISRWADSLFGATESISSMKTIQGLLLRACSKRLLMVPSDSPETPETSSVAGTLNRGIPSSCVNNSDYFVFKNCFHWGFTPAIALTKNVLPQPEGPCSMKPHGGFIPTCLQISGLMFWRTSSSTSCMKHIGSFQISNK